MVGVLVVTHGRLAEALISSVQFLAGNLEKVKGVSHWPKDRESQIKDRIRRKVAELDDGDGVVILTDILGGTPTNLSLSCFENENVHVVTGVNLPMLLTLSSYQKGKSLGEVSRLVKKAGRRSITLANTVLGWRQVRKWKNGDG